MAFVSFVCGKWVLNYEIIKLFGCPFWVSSVCLQFYYNYVNSHLHISLQKDIGHFIFLWTFTNCIAEIHPVTMKNHNQFYYEHV